MKRIALITSLVLTVTLTTLAPVASAADGTPRAMPTDYAQAGVGGGKQYGIPRATPSEYAAHHVGLPRTMPSDYANLGNATMQYGIPRATPSDLAEAGVTLGQQVGVRRAMPSDYAAAGIDVRPTQTGGRSHGVSDSSPESLVGRRSRRPTGRAPLF